MVAGELSKLAPYTVKRLRTPLDTLKRAVIVFTNPELWYFP